jgi:azurin/sugar phosphate isomerase/epimerase
MRFSPFSLLGLLSFSLLFWVSPVSGQEIKGSNEVFRRENLAAWCIVPFDAKKRGPEERAAMLEKMGIRKLAYDYRQEHIAQWDEELTTLKKHHIELFAWWFPATLNDEAKQALTLFQKHGVKPQLWVTGNGGSLKASSAEEQKQRVDSEVARIKPIAEAAQAIGCQVALYNHGGWFGEPDNAIAIVEALQNAGSKNVGIVFNLHHAHNQLMKFSRVLPKLLPHLLCLNLNGMDELGDTRGRKILPIGIGSEDLQVLRAIRESGYQGPLGILNHTDEDAEARLLDNLDGLVWLLPQLDGKALTPRPKYRTWHEKIADFQPEKKPLRAEDLPHWQHPVNRDRIFDFYAKEALHFLKQKPLPELLPAYPGLDGGKQGHWGNQNEDVWRDGRWGQSDLGVVFSTPLKEAGLTIPKAVCLRIGENQELSTCFDPLTLSFPLVWKDGFIKISDVRHGFMGAGRINGPIVEKPEDKFWKGGAVYHGYYRHGKRVVFSYAVDGHEYLDSPSVEAGKFVRVRAEAAQHPLRDLTKGGPAQWPVWLETEGSLGKGEPFATDTLRVPFENPYGALFFLSGHDFFSDGSAAVCTMTGEVWLVRGIDEKLEKLRWKRFATGLHQPLGLKIIKDKIHLLCRDQITCLQDLNGDDEADFYQCISNAQITSPGGHDYITGLDCDAEGRFYFASGNQGLCRVKPGEPVEVLATGFRNPNGLGLAADGTVTTCVQEGDWTPASEICQIKPGAHYGAGGPRNGLPPEPPLLYMPRGEDNSSGGQTFIKSKVWQPLAGAGNLVHLSPGTGSAFLVMRQQVNDRWQGAAVRIASAFESGSQSGRFNPVDGQFYVTGLAGWGSYTPMDGCFQRVRYTGQQTPVPVSCEARENGVLLRYDKPVDKTVAAPASRHFAQCWNYRYSAAYGSPEFSVRHPDTVGHDALEVRSAQVLEDGRALFIEIPQMVPANMIHLHVAVTAERQHDLYLTAHALAPAFADFAGYQPIAKTWTPPAASAALTLPPPAKPNPWANGNQGRVITMEAGLGLQFTQKEIVVKAGESLSLTFKNPDVVPHNWMLAKPGSLQTMGALANALITDPKALANHYVPDSQDVLVYTDMTSPGSSFTIHFKAPATPGLYPYLCTFPGHWMVMNGVMKVE